MGTGRKFHKKPATRPIKSGAARKRRNKVQKERLLALGMTAEEVRRLTSKDVRRLLRTPVKLAASAAATQA